MRPRRTRRPSIAIGRVRQNSSCDELFASGASASRGCGSGQSGAEQVPLDDRPDPPTSSSVGALAIGSSLQHEARDHEPDQLGCGERWPAGRRRGASARRGQPLRSTSRTRNSFSMRLPGPLPTAVRRMTTMRACAFWSSSCSSRYRTMARADLVAGTGEDHRRAPGPAAAALRASPRRGRPCRRSSGGRARNPRPRDARWRAATPPRSRARRTPPWPRVHDGGLARMRRAALLARAARACDARRPHSRAHCAPPRLRAAAASVVAVQRHGGCFECDGKRGGRQTLPQIG